MRKIPVSCNLDCGAGCALLATVDGGRVTDIRDNPRRPPDSAGCARGHHAHETLHSSDRILTPLVRTGPRGSGEYREAEWDEALDLVTRRFADIRDTHGAESILGLAGSGACRGVVHNTSALTRRFLSCVADGYTGTHSGYSSAAQSFALPFIFGRTDVGYDPATLEEARLIILWGANVSDTRFGADLETVLKRIHQRGTPVIAIDPRRSRTARIMADEWIPVRPGTDAALMSAMLYVLIDENLIRTSYLQRYTSGFEALRDAVLGRAGGPACTPGWAETLSGVPATRIVDLARRYAGASPVALISGLSIQRNIGGEEAVRLAVALQAATGNIGIPGGATGCCPWGLLPGPRFGRVPGTAVGRRGPSRTALVYRWPDAVLGDEGFSSVDSVGASNIDENAPIRGIYVVGANYIATGSDIAKNIRAFESTEFNVCHEYMMTATARYCDVILPATTYLERDDVVATAGNYLHYSNKAVDPIGGSRNDYGIFASLCKRMGCEKVFTEGRTADDWLLHLAASSDIDDFDRFKNDGTFDGGEHHRIGLSDFISDPDAHPLPTPTGRIELTSFAYAATGGPEIPGFRGEQPDDIARKRYPLAMVTPHARTRVNSQSARMPWATRSEAQHLLINPADAASRNIENGAMVAVASAFGELHVEVEVTDDIAAGVVSLLAGMWPSDEFLSAVSKSEQRVIESHGAVNMLTSTEPTQPSGGSRTHTNAVEVRPVG